jgi:hypothetical protein
VSPRTRNSSFFRVFSPDSAPVGKANSGKAKADVLSSSACQPIKMRTAPFVIVAFREDFALSLAPVNREASFRNRGVVRFNDARYGKSNTAARREFAVFQSHAVWLISPPDRSCKFTSFE